jgi:hypothetical protein
MLRTNNQLKRNKIKLVIPETYFYNIWRSAKLYACQTFWTFCVDGCVDVVSVVSVAPTAICGPCWCNTQLGTMRSLRNHETES